MYLLLEKFLQLLKKYGLAWGGDWEKFKDYPHFDMTFGKMYKRIKRFK
ncbi:M15 family metallopeptidase [Chishuiella sp.]